MAFTVLRKLDYGLLVVSIAAAYTVRLPSLATFPLWMLEEALKSTHFIDITYLCGIHCASFNNDQAAFTILYYGTCSPPQRVLLQLNLHYSHLYRLWVSPHSSSYMN